MWDFAQYLVANGVWFFPRIGAVSSYFILMFAVGAFLLLGFFMPIGGILTYVERKIAGFTQSRIGPNRVGPWGLAQFLADGIKLILKEDITPAAVDKPLFKLAPYAVVGGAFMVMVVLPLGPNLVAADLPLGLLVYLAASSFVTMGIVMSGWASNNKWSTMGAARSVAQIVSYEIPVGLSLLPLVLLTGSLSFQTFARMQGAYPWQWNVFQNPGLFLCFFCYFIAAIAEINRTPFDIPEAESELVSGYNTEYSGMRFGMFFVAEFANVMVISIIAAVCFLGAWHFPFENMLAAHWFAGNHPAFVCAAGADPATCWGALEHHAFWTFALFNLLGHLALLLKGSFLVVVIILFRWTLPRVRVDQLMDICWKYLVPITLFSSLIVAVWMIVPGAGALSYIAGERGLALKWWNVAGLPIPYLGSIFFVPLLLFVAFCVWRAARGSRHDTRLAHRRKDATAGRAAWWEASGAR